MQGIANLIVGPGPIIALLALAMLPGAVFAQTAALATSEPGKTNTSSNWTAQQDHKNMMEQLGIVRLRPGPSGQPGATNSANYDPAKANPFPDFPDALAIDQHHPSGQLVSHWAD